jgi:hypothetical protein
MHGEKSTDLRNQGPGLANFPIGILTLRVLRPNPSDF